MMGMNTVSTNMLVGTLSLFSLVYFCRNYKKWGGSEIGFPVYIYFSMFPHKLSAFSFFSADDMLLKMLLLSDLLLIILKKKTVKCNVYEIIFLFAVFVADAVAVISSTFYDQSLLLTGAVNILFMFIFSFIFYNRVVSERGMSVIFKIIKHNAIILSIAAVVEFCFYNAKRAELGLNNPNYLAFYLAVALCIFLFNIQELSLKNVCYCALVVIGILCTDSYSILACFPLFVLLKMFYRVSPDRIKPLYSRVGCIGLIVVIISIVALAMSETVLSIPIVSSILNGKDTGRLYIWGDALEDWRNNPIFGVGYNCWKSRYGIGYVTHNDALRILVETGLVGVIAIIIYWFTLTKRIAKSKYQNQPFYLSMMLTVGGFSCFHNNINSIMFWTVLSLPLYDRIISLHKK